MAHNPPRPKSLSQEQISYALRNVKRPPDLSEIAAEIEGRVKAGKRVILLPETALIVARVLRGRGE